MRYSVDKIENGVATLENIENNDLEEVLVSLLPSETKEKSILKKINSQFILDNEEEVKRTKLIQDKLNRLKQIAKNNGSE